MRFFKKIMFILLLLISINSVAQNKAVILDYINKYKDLAIEEMKRTGVPATITLAQGIHESGAGNSQLALASNNHFGIKCKSNWTGETVKHDDDARKECFRKYPTSEDSYRDHSDFLKNGQRYAFLFQLDPTDYSGWANGLKKAGYATNPKYPQLLMKMIEDYGLQEYTMIALGKVPDQNGKTTYGNNDIIQVVQTSPVTATNERKEKQIVPENTVKYPEGEFKINETKVIFVKKGTSFLAIASQYNVDLSKIFEFNEMQRIEEAEKDQLIFLQRKRKTGNDEFHLVLPGETLYDIAQKQAIRLESLRELNWLKKEEMPAPGVRLSLKSKSTTMPKLVVRDNYSLYQGNKINSTN
jgi:LysM repeat protein